MSGKTSPAQMPIQINSRSFYGESPPKRSRLHESNIRPAFKALKDNLIKFDKKLSEPIKSLELKEPHEQQETGEEPKTLDRESPLPLKNLGNTCYENSIIQCLFSLNMFMDNFEHSMKKMRRFVLKPTLRTYDVHCIMEQPQIGVSEATTGTTTENDVRYRIADAFDMLYKSYIKKRIQLETANLVDPSPAKTHEADPASHTKMMASSNFQADFAISQPNAAIPLCKSNSDGKSIDNQAPTSENTDASSTETASTNVDSLSTSNLTPIALVSSTTAQNEPSEIETRLENLKSAVGERSSQFNSTHQQDASEFFYHVIDSIQEFYQSLHKTRDDDNPVTKAFELELDYMIRCPKCHHKSMTEPEKMRTLPLALPHIHNSSNQGEFNHEGNDAPTPPTSDLGLDSPESSTSEEHRSGSDEKENQALDNEVATEDPSHNTMSIAKLDLADDSDNNQQNQQQKHYTLCDALNNYFKDDVLEFKCSQPGCDSKQRTKKCLIRKLPQVLFITLARYSYTGKKNLDEIEAPFELSVPFRENKSPSHSPSAHRDISEDDNKYQLVAVVCHLGSSLNAGHYTSYVYNQNNFSWYCCDDDSITKVQESDVSNDATKSGYCFFYAHKSSINQRHQLSKQEVEPDREEKLVPHKGHNAIVINGNILESSVTLTPESSPKSSPSSTSSKNRTDTHDCHTCCENETNDSDW